MVNLSALVNQGSGNTNLGFGLGGFLNGTPIGNNSEKNGFGLVNRNGLANLFGPQPERSQNNSLLQKLTQPRLTQEEERKEPSPKKDQLDVSEFAKQAAREAVENANQSPRRAASQTQQVFISEDGRFEATIDLQKKADGSFDLDLAVKFAQSSTIAAQQGSVGLLPKQGDAAINNKPTELQFNRLKASAERLTSFEQSLKTRGFEAQIFFEESKKVALNAEQKFNSAAAQHLTSVSSEVAREFTLNISISSKSLDDFNRAAESLLQFDDTGTLQGFLDAARNVINTDSSNLGSFLDAAQGLLNSAQDHVTSKLSNFFTTLQEQFGGSLEEAGFNPEFLQNTGQDVQKDLDSFFKIANNFFENLFGSQNQVEDEGDVQQEQLRVLEENLKKLQEQREEELERSQQDQLQNQLDEERTEAIGDDLLAQQNPSESKQEPIDQLA